MFFKWVETQLEKSKGEIMGLASLTVEFTTKPSNSRIHFEF